MASAKLAIVDPKEWLSRTSVLLGSRGPTLLKVDQAYTNYFNVRSEANRQALYRALDNYLIEKGRYWDKVDRNKRSEGLMEWVHDFTGPGKLGTNVLAKRVPEARHGLLYLWQHAEVNTQWAKVILEGALSVSSSTVGMLQSSNYSSGDRLGGLGVIAQNTRGDTAASDFGTGATIGGLAVAPSGTGVANAAMIPPEKPAPVIRLEDLPDDPTILQRAKHFFGEKFNAIYAMVSAKINEMWEELRLKYARGGFMGTIGGVVTKLINFVLGKILVYAAPFVGNAIEITQGICQAIAAAKDRISAYQKRGMFVVMSGHPTQIANAIETQMNWAIGKGIYSAAKGGAKLAGNLLSLGASALIDVIAACLEFAWKFLSRFLEGRAMREWITTVRHRCGDRNDWKADPKDGAWRPRIVYDDNAFLSLFEQGCQASVCVPMVTLNAGISGDLMMFTRMFDDTGGILGQGTGIGSHGNKPTEGAQRQFDAANEYFTQLKEFGRNYLESTGFTFRSTDPVAAGLMWHAIKHHQGGPMSTGDKVLSFLSGGG